MDVRSCRNFFYSATQNLCLFITKTSHCNPCCTTHFTPQLRILLPKNIYYYYRRVRLPTDLSPWGYSTKLCMHFCCLSAYDVFRLFHPLFDLLDESIVLLRRSNFIQSLSFCLSWTQMFLSPLVYKCPQSSHYGTKFSTKTRKNI